METRKSFFVQILQDEALLQDIFRLRCLAWENSPDPQIINFTKYPEGYMDILDKSSIHFICLNHQQEIVAAARLTKMKDILDLPSPDVFSTTIQFLENKEFLFYSRLVIHPLYRKQGLKESLDVSRIRYQHLNQISYSIGTASRTRAADLTRYGFRIVGSTRPALNSDFPFGNREVVALALGDINPELLSS